MGSILNVSNFWGTVVNHEIPSDPGSPNYSYIHLDQLTTEQEANMPLRPFTGRFGNDAGYFELVRVTDYQNGYITCIRGYENTTPLDHSYPVRFESVLTKGHFDEILQQFQAGQALYDAIIKTLFYTFAGGAKGVVQNVTHSFLQVQVTSPETMGVTIEPGICFLWEKLFILSDQASIISIPAPVSAERQDLIIVDLDRVIIKLGVEGSPDEFLDPAFVYPIPTTTQQLELARLSIPVGTSAITEGMVTDTRVYL